jgi:hypothetical protein
MVGVLTDKCELPKPPDITRTETQAEAAVPPSRATPGLPRPRRSGARTLVIALTDDQLRRLLEQRSESGRDPTEVVLYQGGRRVAVLKVSQARFLA